MTASDEGDSILARSSFAMTSRGSRRRSVPRSDSCAPSQSTRSMSYGSGTTATGSGRSHPKRVGQRSREHGYRHRQRSERLVAHRRCAGAAAERPRQQQRRHRQAECEPSAPCQRLPTSRGDRHRWHRPLHNGTARRSRSRVTALSVLRLLVWRDRDDGDRRDLPHCSPDRDYGPLHLFWSTNGAAAFLSPNRFAPETGTWFNVVGAVSHARRTVAGLRVATRRQLRLPGQGPEAPRLRTHWLPRRSSATQPR